MKMNKPIRSLKKSREELLKRGFWKFVFRKGVLMFGSFFSVALLIITILMNELTWINFIRLIFSGLLAGVTWGVLTWFLTLFLAQHFSHQK